MTDYRLYLLDASGHITRAVELHAQSDRDACAQAEAFDWPGAMELWQRARRLRVWTTGAGAALRTALAS